MDLSSDEIVKILSNVASGKYAKEAALDSIEEIFSGLLGSCDLSFQGMKARDIQILNNTLKVLIERADFADYS
ncbi:hypothetical protein [uncultured Methanolobus sp.]|uniref:hypothetical protein n=1 Tax=uncultured Methanolobus sp. TaxID=218300 RepID=UPI0029C75E4F|nr:hypothetical protein [uncultured Methanolobus sp.]